MSAASARGLFRATGKTPNPVAVRTMDGEIVKADGLPREEDDFYPTPPEPTRAFLAAELSRLRAFPVIWEPACGNGAMVREMLALGFGVAASDAVDRGSGLTRSFYDFTRETKPEGAAIVTNPPYDECSWGNGRARWLFHALDVLDVEYMALLLSWSWPGAGGLAPFWAKHRPARVYLMRWKIDFTGQGAPPMLNAWFVWDRAAEGETMLRMLDRADARQGEMFCRETNNRIPAPAEIAAACERPECDGAGRAEPARHDDGPVAVDAGLEAPPADTAHRAAGGEQSSPALRPRHAESDDDFEIPAFLRRQQPARSEAA